MDHSQDIKIHFLDYWRIIRLRLGLVFLVFLLVFGTAAVVTHFRPREYSSFATIELQPDMTSVRIFDNRTEALNNPTYDPKFVPPQFQIITRKGVLYPVIGERTGKPCRRKSPAIYCKASYRCKRSGTPISSRLQCSGLIVPRQHSSPIPSPRFT